MLEIHAINESTLFIRNLIHDIGVRLKCYAVCVQIRRTKYGFADVDSSLAFNEFEFKKLCDSSNELTQKARNFIKKYDKTILVGHENNDAVNREISEEN